jgi:hypothetical protein
MRASLVAPGRLWLQSTHHCSEPGKQYRDSISIVDVLDLWLDL